jgi:APA family basic amino acid/polyamine antiporter
MIGSGIFTTSGFIARNVGSPWLLFGVWFAGGLISITGALAYAELGAAMPEAGGEYVYLREAYGPLIAYLSGWTSLFVGFSGAIAAGALAFVGYLHGFVPGFETSATMDKVVALLALWTIAASHVYGIGTSSVLQRSLAATTVAAIVTLVGAGFLFGRGSVANFASSAPINGSVAVSLILVLFAYSGWNAAAYVAGEIREPERNLPRALCGGAALVTALYLALNAMYTYALPITAMSGVLAVAEKAATVLLGSHAARSVAAILSVTILGSTSAMVLAGPRVYLAMARDRLLPGCIALVDRAHGTPARAILLQTAWASVLIIFFGTFEPLVIYTGLAVTGFTAAAVASVIVLRGRRADLRRPFTMRGYPWTAIAFVAVALWVIVFSSMVRPTEAALSLLTVLAGVPFYFVWQSGREWFQ